MDSARFCFAGDTRWAEELPFFLHIVLGNLGWLDECRFSWDFIGSRRRDYIICRKSSALNIPFAAP